MSNETPNPAPNAPTSRSEGVKSVFRLDNLIAFILVCCLISAVILGISRFKPPEMPEGRPIGGAGKVQALAFPAPPAGEGFAIWRDGRPLYTLPNEQARNFQRIELSSNEVDIAGSKAPDLVLYTWTGGAHCCFSQILIDGHTGQMLGKLELGNGDPTPFLPATKPGLARAATVNVDDVSAHQFGSYADSPMARIVVIWDGKRFVLDKKRMIADGPDSPPTYFISEPDLGDAVPLNALEIVEGEAPAALSPKPGVDGSSRGDRAKYYQAWMQDVEARMQAAVLNQSDEASYGPMAAFLNERIYKGQGVAGVTSVMAAYNKTPQTRDIALNYYFRVLKQSRWYDDLNALNGGMLSSLPPAPQLPQTKRG